jgi:BirA family transcriptional regulator, biotin operon repressor / biotin---[acetyl-CoA-carboxylase] ligase
MAFALGPKAQAAGYRLVVHDTIASTNQDALQRATAGDPGRLWVASTHQSAGRGRRGRLWETPVGNLAASLLLLVDEGAAVGATLGFAAGVALDEALRRVAPSLDVAMALDAVEKAGEGGRDRLRLKWPNDIILDGAKLAGILLEAQPMAGGGIAIVIGIGVNVTAAPRGLPYPATALAELGVAVDAAGLFGALSEAWVGVARIWDGGRGFGKVRDIWLERATGLGQPAAVRIGSEVFSGVFETIDDDGRLIIRTAEGDRRAISAGEVHFASAATVRA